MEEQRARSRSVSVRVRRSSTSAARAAPAFTPLDATERNRAATAEPAVSRRQRALTISDRLQLTEISEEEPKSLSVDLGDHHDDAEVELLDVLDPRVSTAANLSNVASAFWPSSLKQAPVCELDDSTDSIDQSSLEDGLTSAEHADPLDAHVLKLLRRQKRKQFVKETLKGTWAFVKTPVGMFFAVYMLAVVFFGAGLVLILVTAIPMNSYHRKLWVEIFSQVLTGLFCITSLLPLPWRLRDWFRICTIWYYQRVTIAQRRRLGLSPLRDPNDLPEDPESPWIAQGGIAMTTPRFKTYKLPPKQKKAAKSKRSLELATGSRTSIEPMTNASSTPVKEFNEEADIAKQTTVDEEQPYEEELPVLSSKQMHRLRHAQAQTYYRAHSTLTHHAFPISLAFGIQTLLVWNSIFQALLCAAMWGYNRFNRPAWMTGLLIPLSFLCMIVASILIWKGAEWTKRKQEVSDAVWKMLKAEQLAFEQKRKDAIDRCEQDKKKAHVAPKHDDHHHHKLVKKHHHHGHDPAQPQHSTNHELKNDVEGVAASDEGHKDAHVKVLHQNKSLKAVEQDSNWTH